MKYAVVIERGTASYGASVPDLPGCIAVGATREAVERLIQEAIALHIAELREEGLALPTPDTRVTTIDVA
ncbi:MAG TPA: type II toxin-antitoxin system HicB family antitoxin [Vicinamibacterales bacterium]